MTKRTDNRSDNKTVYCRQCRGTLTMPDFRLPYGWLQLTVGVPEEMSTDGRSGQGRGYLWIGMFCSAACLAAAMPEIEEQEALARHAYEAEVPNA